MDGMIFYQMSNMDYGERQERAQMLIDILKQKSQNIFTINNRTYTGKQVVEEIESMTDLGKSIVATAGLVFRAVSLPRKSIVIEM